jgi:hypothetical protein
MKRIYTLLAAILIGASFMNAQVIFSEDFDGIGGPTAGGAGTYVFPAGWLLRNVDNVAPSANVSYINDAWERREDFNFNVADSAAFSTSWTNPAGIANDWMWTPLIGPIPANCVLKWNAVTYDAAFPDGYEVRIMTATQGPPTGSNGVIGNQITNSSSAFTIAAENTTWTARQVSLSAYAGQSVYIGFRNNSNDKFLLLIDDIIVETQVNVDAEMVFADTTTEYTITPVTQTAPLTFNGTIRNNGVQSLSNVSATVNVYNGATLVHTASSSPVASLAPAATTNWTINGFTPTTIGTYTVEFIANQTSGTDQVAGNNMLTQTFLVTDTIYARDNGNATGALGIGDGSGGYLGQDFIITSADIVTSVDVFFTRGYTGRQLAVVIWDMPSGTPANIIGGTDTLLYPDDSARVYNLRLTGGGLQLNPGRYAFTAIEFDSTLALATAPTLFTQNRTWVDWPTNPINGWANNEDFGFNVSYILRPNFGDPCLDNTVSITSNSDATCGNCTDGSATATATGTDGNVTYAWSNGGTTATVNNLAPGVNIVTVTDGFGCQAVDTIIVQNNCSSYNVNYTIVDASCGSCPDGNITSTPVNAVAPLSYVWSNGDTIANPINLVPGQYIVTVTDASGCSVTDTVFVSFTTSLNALAQTNLTEAFPNPNFGNFTLNYAFEQTTDLMIEVVAANGQVVYHEMINNTTNGQLQINAQLAAGNYNLRVRTGLGSRTLQFLVK